MNKAFCALLTALFLLSGIIQSRTGGQDVVIGKKHAFFSKILGEERTFSVYLPRGYDHANAKYPLLIALDGYFLWTIGTVDYLSFAGEIRSWWFWPSTAPTVTVTSHRPTQKTWKVRRYPAAAAPETFCVFWKRNCFPIWKAVTVSNPFACLPATFHGRPLRLLRPVGKSRPLPSLHGHEPHPALGQRLADPANGKQTSGPIPAPDLLPAGHGQPRRSDAQFSPGLYGQTQAKEPGQTGVWIYPL